MALNDINRVRIIMDLIKDGEVANESAYVNLDMFDAVRADAWVEAFYECWGPLYDNEGAPIAYASLTNAQKATFYMQQLIEFHRQARLTHDVKVARDAATAAAQASIDTDLATDFGA